MSYSRTTWVDGTTPLNASNMNQIEAGLVNTSSTADAKYSKPATGIPKSDLATDVQASLSKIDQSIGAGETAVSNTQLAAAISGINNGTTLVNYTPTNQLQSYLSSSAGGKFLKASDVVTLDNPSTSADATLPVQKQSIEAALATKSGTDNTYTKTEVDNKLAQKQKTLVSGTNIKSITNASGTAQTLLGANTLDVRDIFIAVGPNTEGLTLSTYAAVKAAWDAGKHIIAKCNGMYFPLNRFSTIEFENANNQTVTTPGFTFVGSNDEVDEISSYFLSETAPTTEPNLGNWSDQNILNIESTSNKITEFTDSTISDAAYPSAKLVYESIQKLGLALEDIDYEFNELQNPSQNDLPNLWYFDAETQKYVQATSIDPGITYYRKSVAYKGTIGWDEGKLIITSSGSQASGNADVYLFKVATDGISTRCNDNEIFRVDQNALIATQPAQFEDQIIISNNWIIKSEVDNSLSIKWAGGDE